MRTDAEDPKLRRLTRPLSCWNRDGTQESIPIGFGWDGSSVPLIFRGFFPRHDHPVASCRHDWRCGKAKNKADRLYADQQFQIDVGKTSWWITKKFGYIGVRIGAFFGIGNNF